MVHAKVDSRRMQQQAANVAPFSHFHLIDRP